MEIIPTQKIVNRDGVKAVKNGQKGNQYSHIPNLKKPDWLRVKAQFNPNFHKIKLILRPVMPKHNLNKIHLVGTKNLLLNVQSCHPNHLYLRF